MFDSMYATWADAMAPWLLPLALVGLAGTPAGIVLMMWTGGRRFGRRNFAGVQEFDSFGSSVLLGLGEGLVSLLGRLLLVVGLFALFAAAYGWYLQRY